MEIAFVPVLMQIDCDVHFLLLSRLPPQQGLHCADSQQHIKDSRFTSVPRFHTCVLLSC